jgi:hypothetical protein
MSQKINHYHNLITNLVKVESRVEYVTLLDVRENPLLHVLPVRVEKLYHLTDLTLTGSTHGQRVTAIENTKTGKTTNSEVQ